MTSHKRVSGAALAAAVLSAGVLVASPATSAAPAHGELTGVKLATGAKQTAKLSTARAKISCGLSISFKPRVGKGHKRIRSRARVHCGTKQNPGPRMPHIWTSIQVKADPGKDRYKKTDVKNMRHNKATLMTFCAREARDYTIIGRATVKLPKSAVKKQIKLRKVGHQSGRCRA